MSEKPRITIKLREGRFEPATAFDAEALAQYSGEQMFDLLPISKRSPEHHKLYWSLLGKAVKATGKWPTSEHLHRDLKMTCGYYTTVVNEFGGVYLLPDTIAMKKMDQKQFNEFFETAMEKLSDALGFDPMELLNDVC